LTLGVIFTPKNMKRDFLLGGTKLPTGGAVRGAGGAMSPPVFMLKEALVLEVSVGHDTPGKYIVQRLNLALE
jgi:hypothetical protein